MAINVARFCSSDSDFSVGEHDCVQRSLEGKKPVDLIIERKEL